MSILKVFHINKEMVEIKFIWPMISLALNKDLWILVIFYNQPIFPQPLVSVNNGFIIHTRAKNHPILTETKFNAFVFFSFFLKVESADILGISVSFRVLQITGAKRGNSKFMLADGFSFSVLFQLIIQYDMVWYGDDTSIFYLQVSFIL